jgi:hypothetical protein
MTEPAEPRAACRLSPDGLLHYRCLGSLDAVTDTERRALRPIGTTAHEVAVRTGGLLSELLALPGVRLFQGLRSGPSNLPHIPHAVCAGSRVVLIDSVAWPPGRYAVTAGGQIHCDDVYIGQSVRPLITAARHWRQVLPPGHQVRALVVVHLAGAGSITLPAETPQGPTWASAANAVRELRAFLARAGPQASAAMITTLLTATAGPGR